MLITPVNFNNTTPAQDVNENGSLENHSVASGSNLGARIGRTLIRIAPIAIGILSVANLPGAEGGPWAACLTIAACLPLAEVPPLFAACLAAAGIALAAPTP